MKRIHDWDNAINSMALNPSLPRPQIEPFPADIYNSNYAKVDASEMDPTDNSDRNESPGEVGSSDSAVPETRVLPRFKNVWSSSGCNRDISPLTCYLGQSQDIHREEDGWNHW